DENRVLPIRGVKKQIPEAMRAVLGFLKRFGRRYSSERTKKRGPVPAIAGEAGVELSVKCGRAFHGVSVPNSRRRLGRAMRFQAGGLPRFDTQVMQHASQARPSHLKSSSGKHS